MRAELCLDAILVERALLVCVGSGGTGKTTIAAALALEAARRGRKVLVLTIDPARRLADALGVEALGNRPQPIERARLGEWGVPAAGELFAMMLDMKRTFDDLVERFAREPAIRERIFANPIYQHISNALAGSVEYSAMEKVFEMHESGRFDLIVVDTPPAQHALDFLEAPQRLIEFLDSRLVKMLIHPAFAAGRLSFRLFHRGTQRLLQLLERITGIGFLEDVSEFLIAFDSMADGFRDRAERVQSLLRGAGSAFVLVSGPGRESALQASALLERIERHGVLLAGAIANRLRLWPSSGAPPLDSEPRSADVAKLSEALRASEGDAYPAALAAARYAAWVRSDALAAEPLRERIHAQGRFWIAIPEFDGDVHDLSGLAQMADRIAARTREP